VHLHQTNPAFPLAVLVLRIALGTMWLAHGIVLKLMQYGVPGLAKWMAGEGIPPQLAWPLVIAEVMGGWLILLGIHGRWASLALQPILVGALAIHAKNGWVFSSANGGWEYPLFLIAASVVHMLLGDGRFAVRPQRAPV
jgi:putative oxidoreductase